MLIVIISSGIIPWFSLSGLKVLFLQLISENNYAKEEVTKQYNN